MLSMEELIVGTWKAMPGMCGIMRKALAGSSAKKSAIQKSSRRRRSAGGAVASREE